MHRRPQSYDDIESLQADVMRFMAIIAFCLIAILALVKHAEPQTETTSAVPAEPVPDLPPAAPEPAPTPQPSVLAAAPEPIPEPAVPVVPAAEPEPVLAPIAETMVEAPPSPIEQAPIEQTPMEHGPPKPTVASTPAEPATEPTVTEPEDGAEDGAEDSAEDEGLILRFASDGDFLRLIARGDIQVYAFQNTDVLTLSETYRFLDTQSPGQVYELLRPSIPSLIVDALKQARADIDGFRWGIALPGHISNQIEQHLGRVTRGQLVIDRYGDVHHVAAS